MPDDNPLGTAIAFAGETVVPGAANFLQGDVKDGLLYLAAGVVAGTMFGVPGLILVSASSFAKAMTGSHLIQIGVGSRPEARSVPADTAAVESPREPEASPARRRSGRAAASE